MEILKSLIAVFWIVIGNGQCLTEYLRSESIIYGLATIEHSDSKCSKELQKFVDAIPVKKLWALKMLDSSGRPGDGFLWGNNYWVGKQAQCKAAMDRQPLPTSPKYPTFQNVTEDDLPPFDINFFGAYVRHNFTLQQHVNLPNEDLIEIGLCLPSICEPKEIENRLRNYFDEHTLNVQKFYNFELDVIKVKNMADDFEWLHSKQFVLMMSIVGTVTICTIVGTILDVKNKDKLIRRQKSNLNNNNIILHRDKVGSSPKVLVPSVMNTEQEYKSFMKKFFLCFSLKRNASIILNTNIASDSLACIHGIRFGSMLWVIMAHTIFYISDFADNKPLVWRLSDVLSTQIFVNAVFGFLVSYLYYKTNLSKIGTIKFKLSTNCLNFIGMVLRRYLRLTPTLLIAIVIFSVNYQYYSKTSIFEMDEVIHERCAKYWWRNLLYINNLYPWNELCLSWTWYLSADLQFFMVSSALVLLSTMYFVTSFVIMVVLILISCFINGYIAYSINLLPTMDEQLKALDLLYDKPWNRIAPYLIGTITGYYVVKLNGQLELRKSTLVLCWIIGPLINLTILFGLTNKYLPLMWTTLYTAFSRTLWGIGLAWMLIACTTNNAGFLNTILSYRGFIPFSRMSFCAYLLNPFLMTSVNLDSEVSKHMEFISLGVIGFGMLFGSFLCGFIFCVLFETPTIRIMNIFTKSSTSAANKKKLKPIEQQ